MKMGKFLPGFQPDVKASYQPRCFATLSLGWSGCGGLGAKEQGIQDPIRGGDIRDKWDQFKGVGVSLDDPYENYRKNKSYNFVARMKAREEGKSASAPLEFHPGHVSDPVNTFF